MANENDNKEILLAINGVKEELKELRSDVAELKSDVAELKSDVAELKSDVAELKTDVAQLKTDVKKLDGRVSNLESNVESMKLIVENDIRREIRIVAEGHLDLSRQLAGLQKRDSESEMLKLRVSMLESDVRNLKIKMA